MNIGKRLDKVLRVFTLDRAGHRCERCRMPEGQLTALGGRLEDAHYERRGKKATRWHPDNRAALCVGSHEPHGGCHRVIDAYTPPHERRAFFAARRGEDAITEVDSLVREPWDRDLGAIIERLRSRGVDL